MRILLSCLLVISFLGILSTSRLTVKNPGPKRALASKMYGNNIKIDLEWNPTSFGANEAVTIKALIQAKETNITLETEWYLPEGVQRVEGNLKKQITVDENGTATDQIVVSFPDTKNYQVVFNATHRHDGNSRHSNRARFDSAPEPTKTESRGLFKLFENTTQPRKTPVILQ